MLPSRDTTQELDRRERYALAPAAPQTGPLAGPTGMPLLPLLPLLWYLIHSCSLPYVIYYFIFD
jgi:hypothetical protein